MAVLVGVALAVAVAAAAASLVAVLVTLAVAVAGGVLDLLELAGEEGGDDGAAPSLVDLISIAIPYACAESGAAKSRKEEPSLSKTSTTATSARPGSTASHQ